MAFYVLRLGHRPMRDKRVTTHVCLVARAMGAKGIYIAGAKDEHLSNTMEKIIGTWGGEFWVKFSPCPLKLVREWRAEGGKVVHLTMYGLPLRQVMGDILSARGNTLIVVGGEKVPREYYEESDYNVSVGSQPHSEVAALAIFLDRVTNGQWETMAFRKAKVEITPSERGKNVQQLH